MAKYRCKKFLLKLSPGLASTVYHTTKSICPKFRFRGPKWTAELLLTYRGIDRGITLCTDEVTICTCTFTPSNMYKRGLYTVSSVQMNVRRQYFSVQIDGNLHLKKSTPHPQTLPPYPALFKSLYTT